MWRSFILDEFPDRVKHLVLAGGSLEVKELLRRRVRCRCGVFPPPKLRNKNSLPIFFAHPEVFYSMYTTARRICQRYLFFFKGKLVSVIVSVSTAAVSIRLFVSLPPATKLQRMGTRSMREQFWFYLKTWVPLMTLFILQDAQFAFH